MKYERDSFVVRGMLVADIIQHHAMCMDGTAFLSPPPKSVISIYTCKCSTVCDCVC